MLGTDMTGRISLTFFFCQVLVEISTSVEYFQYIRSSGAYESYLSKAIGWTQAYTAVTALLRNVLIKLVIPACPLQLRADIA